jgi:hypothetical protein
MKKEKFDDIFLLGMAYLGAIGISIHKIFSSWLPFPMG